ncbi:hypothetical protein B0H10DRAFT_1949366 [Mycena sp. CBHHK59/15]|nr:hypothetical protein B0H10DRAFT_1949366 [Mycena sp. CBHHK59/15]
MCHGSAIKHICFETSGSFRVFSVKNWNINIAVLLGGDASARMSQLPTRHSRRLEGQPASPQPDLPARMRRSRAQIPPVALSATDQSLRDGKALDEYFLLHMSLNHGVFAPIYGGDPLPHLSEQDAVTLRQLFTDTAQFFSDTQQSIDSLLSSSPSYPLAPILESPGSPDTNISGSHSPINQPTLHSPRASYPVSRSISASSNWFGLGPGFHLQVIFERTPVLEDEAALTPPLALESPLAQTPMNPQGLPGRGSLAHLRMRRALTPAVNPVPILAAIYVGFPFHENHARRNFFQSGLRVTSATPSVSDLIHVIRQSSSVLENICVDLHVVPFHIAWSRNMVEVHDLSYSAVAHGYSEVVLEPARHNATSRTTFNMHHIPEETALFVLYIFPVNINIPRAITAIPPLPRSIQSSLPDRRSRSRTPAPAGIISIPQFLTSMLKTHSALDQNFLEDGSRLANLLVPRYGGAYLKIRQALIIEDVWARAQGIIPALTVHDVAAWAGLKPTTYANNRTFAIQARGTLQFLRARANSDEMLNQSDDVRRKEADLVRFLGGCFAEELLSEDWDAAESSEDTLTIGASHTSTVKQKIQPYKNLSSSYRTQRFTIV